MKRFVGMLGLMVVWSGILGGPSALADWLWTPESGKWISEKNIQKKSAMLLYEQAQGQEQAGDYKKAVATYKKLIEKYPASSVAPNAQYWVGHLMEEQGNYYQAFREYQKLIQNYPSYKKFNEILERQYQIGNLYLAGEKRKVLGFSILPAVDKSIEIFETIVRTAPYSAVAPRAQFNLGEAYRKVKRYSAAIPEYQKLIENYPESDLTMEARYQIGRCGYQKTLSSAYDQSNTEVALDSMKTFVQRHGDSKRVEEVQRKQEELVERKAKKAFDIAQFYHKAKQEEAALIYYQEVLDDFPESQYAQIASKKIDELIIRPTRKEFQDEKGRKGFSVKLWPFGKKEGEEAPQAIEQKERPNVFAGLWPFGKRKVNEPVVEQAAASESKQKGGKPFWAFWVKEEEKSLVEIPQGIESPSRAASQMKLPQRDIAMDRNVPEPVPVLAQAPVPGPAQAPAPPIPSVLQLKSFQMEQEGSVLRLMFETNADLKFKTFFLKDPSRVLVSFPGNVMSQVQETIPVNKMGVHSVRQHFRNKDGLTDVGRLLNAIVVDLEDGKEVKIYNDIDTLVIEVERG